MKVTNPRAIEKSIPKSLQEAIGHHSAGRLFEAEALYQKILELKSNHSDALHLLGVIALQKGNNGIAIELISKAIRINSSLSSYHCSLGSALMASSKLDEAVTSYRRAILLQPSNVEAHSSLGAALQGQGKLDEAVVHYRKAISIKPNFADALYNFGNLLNEQGKFAEAVEHYLKALKLNPNFAEAHNNLGSALKHQGKLSEAIVYYHKAITARPEFAEAYNNLGGTLQELGKLNEAIEAFRCALKFKLDYAEAFNNLGTALHAQGWLDAAVENLKQALVFKPDYADAHNNLGNALKDLGKFNQAINHYCRTLTIKPDFSNAHSNLLFALIFHPDLSVKDVYLASLEYEAQRGGFSWPHHNNDRDPLRPLRIAYVSPDFRRHPVAIFAEPVFANHDKSQLEIFCYAEVMLEDEVTARFRHYADHWYSTVGMSDKAVANMIRDHKVDILIDLAGHTAHNRLPVFARKPAPIQLTYLGYPGTTGLSAMDYRITDQYADPEGINDAWYTEHLLRLPNSLCCYRPSDSMPTTSPLPALTRGYLTFGSFNNFNKIDQPALELWSELLKALPTARLIMLTVPEGEARQRLAYRFAQLGISEQRLDFHGKLPAGEFHRKFLEVDISLDPISISGGTTTCESLWMGVPVMALAGNRFIQRVSYSFLNTAGLGDFASTSREDYLRTACHLAENLPLLAEIRAGLREHLRSTPLLDEIGFTRNLEYLYREIWKKWCYKEDNKQ